MHSMFQNKQLITITSIIFLLALFRLLPHWPNVSPVAAMALFGGAYFADKRLAFIVPFAALFLSDLVLGLHNSMIFVYAGFALTVVIGFLLKDRVNVTNTAFAVVAFIGAVLPADKLWRLDNICVVCKNGSRFVAGLCCRHSFLAEFLVG